MLDEEGHVKSNDHEPEGPFTEPLREHAAAHFRKPILQATDDCEDDRAYRHKVKMCDEKVAVLSLPIERHNSVADSSDPGDKELNEKRDAEQHRHVKSDAAADHGRRPVEHFYTSWNCNEHRGNGEKDIEWTTHSHREHVVSPDTQA